MVGGFGSKIQGRKPRGRVGRAITRTLDACANALHDILRMPIHHGVLEVESLQVSYSGGLYFLRETKMTT